METTWLAGAHQTLAGLENSTAVTNLTGEYKVLAVTKHHGEAAVAISVRHLGTQDRVAAMANGSTTVTPHSINSGSTHQEGKRVIPSRGGGLYPLGNVVAWVTKPKR